MDCQIRPLMTAIELSFGRARRALNALCLCCALMAPWSYALASAIEPGHSGMWWDPERNGEGWVLEVLPNDRAVLYWYTYDEQGAQRWMLGVGDILRDEAGDSIDFTLYATEGGRFGDDFDPNDVVEEVVGSAQMQFADCFNGEFSFNAYGQSLAIDIVRLSETMAAGCAPIHGVPGFPAYPHAGQSGSWYDISHTGEGFSLLWMPNNKVLLTWYTYDTEGNQYWMVGSGALQDDQIVIPQLYSTRGAKFGAAFDADDVELIEWGSLALSLDCDAGTVGYQSGLAEFGSGGQQLTRLTRLEKPACPWVAPKFTDLYEVTWTELPIAPGTVSNPNTIEAMSIADDGTVVAMRRSGGFRALLFPPGATEWEEIPGAIARGVPIFMDSTGKSLAATDDIDAAPGSPSSPLLWTAATGWKPITGLAFDESWLTAASRDLDHLAGEGSTLGEVTQYPWVWNAQQGQIQLPLTESVPIATPTAVSADGTTVVGFSILPGGGGEPVRTLGVRWTDLGEPEVLYDQFGVRLGQATACDLDCSLIYGTGQADFTAEHPNLRQAWFWKSPGNSGYLGELPDAIVDAGIRPYYPSAATADGSLVVGTYLTVKPGTSELETRAFVWTQFTGLESVRDLFSTTGLTDDNWDEMAAVSVTSGGRRILIRGDAREDPENPSGRLSRAGVLQLHKK